MGPKHCTSSRNSTLYRFLFLHYLGSYRNNTDSDKYLSGTCQQKLTKNCYINKKQLYKFENVFFNDLPHKHCQAYTPCFFWRNHHDKLTTPLRRLLADCTDHLDSNTPLNFVLYLYAQHCQCHSRERTALISLIVSPMGV